MENRRPRAWVVQALLTFSLASMVIAIEATYDAATRLAQLLQDPVTRHLTLYVPRTRPMMDARTRGTSLTAVRSRTSMNAIKAIPERRTTCAWTGILEIISSFIALLLTEKMFYGASSFGGNIGARVTPKMKPVYTSMTIPTITIRRCGLLS